MGTFWIWIDWTRELVALSPRAGFDRLPFVSRERRAANVRILLEGGCRLAR